MLILARYNQILSHYDDGQVVSCDVNNNEVLLYTNVSPTVFQIVDSGGFHGFAKLTDIFNLSDIKNMYIAAYKVYIGNIINNTYPAFKQANITRLASPYTQTDLDQMHNFIDKQRVLTNDKETAINDITNINELVAINLYTYGINQ